MALRTALILLHAVSALGIRLNSVQCTPLQSGAKIHLKSNTLDNHFVTVGKGSGDCGTPKQWQDFKHYDCSKFHLEKGTSKNSAFRIVSEAGGPIVSGDKVQLVVDKDDSQMSLAFDGYAWPFPLTTDKKGSSLEITRARKVSLLPNFIMMQSNAAVHEDKTAGDPICDNTQVFLRIADEGSPGPMYDGTYLYMQGDKDKVVGFPHHFPGFNGKPETTRDMSKWTADDEKATSNRFTIVAEAESEASA